jgi:hypothetical protein
VVGATICHQSDVVAAAGTIMAALIVDCNSFRDEIVQNLFVNSITATSRGDQSAMEAIDNDDGEPACDGHPPLTTFATIRCRLGACLSVTHNLAVVCKTVLSD